MQIEQKYSHLNGEEYLIVHHSAIYEEIRSVIESVEADQFKTKVSKERGTLGRNLYSPTELNAEFKRLFADRGWSERRYSYFVTTDRTQMEETMNLPLDQQREHLIACGQESPIRSYKQTDFVNETVAVEVQFGKYAFVAYDLFVKHMLFYSGGVINVGVEILPVKAMQSEMSSGIAYYEGEVYNVLRQGRSNPPVPLLILGITA
ncbi:restriction endonuclease [bacterium]|nr:restriction endonuclease [bacterium]